MTDQFYKALILLIPLLPFLGFLINGLGRKSLSKTLISLVGCGTLLLSFVLSIWVFIQVKNGNIHTVNYFDFISVRSLQIPFAFQIDQLSSVFLLIITGVGFLIHVYSTSYMHEESTEHFGRYFSYLNLFIFSMLLLVMGANYVIMFIGWEGVGLCSYLLIGYWFKNTEYTKAANKAFVMNRIGDLGFLIAIFWIISKVGNTNFSDVFAVASGTVNGKNFTTTDVTAITLLLFFGATGKSAQIPLYTWLPDAMAGPTPVSALIHAATMVTAGIYMIARSNVLYSMSELSQNVVAIVGLATAILAATIALKQNDIKKILAYSTISQLGYMFLALGVGAYSAGVFHVMTHAFFKALLFLGAGSVIHAMGGEQDIRKMGGLNKLKTTSITFLIGCIAIAGVPPFSGFFSKDAILLSTFEHNKILYAVALFGAMLTAYYMFRLFVIAFTGEFRGTEEQKKHLHESPTPMTITLIILAILSVIGGFVGIPDVIMKGGDKFTEFLSPVVSNIKNGEPVSSSTELLLMALSTALVVAAIVFAWFRFRRCSFPASKGIGKVLENKWYMDEIYDAIIVKPLNKLGEVLNEALEKSGIDALVNGVGKAVQYGGRQLRWLQSGQVGSYVLLMVVSMVLFFVLQFFLRK